MVDMTKCATGTCPIKETCYRYTAPDSMWQSYSDFSINLKKDKPCEYFVKIFKPSER